METEDLDNKHIDFVSFHQLLVVLVLNTVLSNSNVSLLILIKTVPSNIY